MNIKLIIILIISILANIAQYKFNAKLSDKLKSCNEIASTCETTYDKEVKSFNEKQLQASNTIKKLQETVVNDSFENCLNMRIPDSYLRVYRGESNSNQDSKTKN